jgi:hypothetical protein
LASGITAFSTTAERRAKRERLKTAKSLATGSILGSSFLALMTSAFEEASTIRAWIASTSKFGLGGWERGG